MSGDASAVLALPYILPSQAQKHVTHNEALRLLDVLVQPAVASRSVTAPPPGAVPGARHIVPAGATGAFAGQEGRIAFLDGNGWDFLVPRPGWSARVLDEGIEVVFDGSAWTGPAESVARFAGLGIATPADAVNRLAVAAPATLLTHAGAGHQLKINKAGATDTASLLFQTGWSGRAEMGTPGGHDFEIRTSADGVAFQTALRAAAAGGRVGLPAGVTLAPGNAAAPALSFEGDADTGLCRPAPDVLVLAAGGAERARVSAAGLDAANLLRGGSQVFSRNNLLGAVSQSGGVPTGALIETGSNANGRYLRLPDGTQICWQDISVTDQAIEAPYGPVYLGVRNWTFPAAFAAQPAVPAPACRWGTGASWGSVGAFPSPLTTVTFRLFDALPRAAGTAFTASFLAIGRWF